MNPAIEDVGGKHQHRHTGKHQHGQAREINSRIGP